MLTAREKNDLPHSFSHGGKRYIEYRIYRENIYSISYDRVLIVGDKNQVFGKGLKLIQINISKVKNKKYNCQS